MTEPPEMLSSHVCVVEHDGILSPLHPFARHDLIIGCEFTTNPESIRQAIDSMLRRFAF